MRIGVVRWRFRKPRGARERLRMRKTITNEWSLGRDHAIANAIELSWRRNFGPRIENGIEERKHLFALDRGMGSYKDEHAYSSDNFLSNAGSLFRGRPNPQDLLGRL